MDILTLLLFSLLSKFLLLSSIDWTQIPEENIWRDMDKRTVQLLKATVNLFESKSHQGKAFAF